MIFQAEIQAKTVSIELPHRKIHDNSGNSYVCQHCNKKFTSFQAKVNHEKIGCRAVEKPFSCEHCYSKFSLLRNLKYHQLLKCKAFTPPPPEKKEKRKKFGQWEKCPRSDPLHVICEVCGCAVFCSALPDHMKIQGHNSIEKKFGLSFGLKNGLIFHFDSETCLRHF